MGQQKRHWGHIVVCHAAYRIPRFRRCGPLQNGLVTLKTKIIIAQTPSLVWMGPSGPLLVLPRRLLHVRNWSLFIRHNLMQVAQILQVLVVSKREDIDPKVGDLYSKFQVIQLRMNFVVWLCFISLVSPRRFFLLLKANALSQMIESLLDQSVVDGQSPAHPSESMRSSSVSGNGSCHWLSPLYIGHILSSAAAAAASAVTICCH